MCCACVYVCMYVCMCVLSRRFDFSPSQLKSLLQKNIRMSRPMAAVRSALQLAVRAGLNELLRRLSVIMLEDAILHPRLPLLLWLSLVCGEKRKDSSGGSGSVSAERRDERLRVLGKDGAAENRSMCHPPTLQLLNAVLQIVFDIAAVAVKDSSRPESEELAHSPLPQQQPPLSLADADCAGVSIAQLLYVRCLLLRAQLGGMEGDMAMMRRFAALWARRFAAENRQTAVARREPSKTAAPRRWLPFLSQLFDNSRAKHSTAASSSSQQQQQLSALTVASVQDDDILLSAIDQHCSPLIDQLRAEHSRVRDGIAQHVAAMKQQQQQRDEKEAGEREQQLEGDVADGRVDVVRLLNAAIWRHRSSVTNKRPLLQSSKHTSPTAAAAEQQDSDASYQLFQIIKAEADQISRRIVSQRLRR